MSVMDQYFWPGLMVQKSQAPYVNTATDSLVGTPSVLRGTDQPAYQNTVYTGWDELTSETPTSFGLGSLESRLQGIGVSLAGGFLALVLITLGLVLLVLKSDTAKTVVKAAAI